MRNGFGPVKYVTESFAQQYSYDKNHAYCRKLQLLLLSFTCVEEAAIRTISPLISIVRLMHGSIKSKGNTSCVWQKSQLSLVLPNLPSECKYIIINCRNNKGKHGKSQIVSTKFERCKIERALELLSKTVPGVWKNDDKYPQFKIEYSKEKLNVWSEKGDITELKDVPTVYE